MKFNPLHYPYPSNRNVVYGRNGMVATTQNLAAGAGLTILQKGGNAIDAAIATAACLTVTEPTSNGIGSDNFALIWTKGKLCGLNSSGAAPMGISIEALKKQNFETMPTFGVQPVTVPGTVAGWVEANARFGKLSLEECLDPAINYAEKGYPISPVLGYFWERAFSAFKNKFNSPEFENWFATFAVNDRAPAIGEIYTLKDHARTLEEIAQTKGESFYRGNLADKIHNFFEEHNGFLRKSDLESFKSEWVEPVSANYRDYHIWEIPPNGQGIAALIALNILKAYDIGPDELSYHRQIEAIKIGFAVAKATVTDPKYMKYSTEDLLSESFTEELRSRITDKAQNYGAITPAKSGTVYLATADGEGNMVSFIQSNYMGFGSGIVIPGTGIAMQNRGHDFSLDPNHINALAPGKKTYHTIIPGFITKNNEAVGPFGVMGGYMQPQGHVQVVVNMVDFELNPQTALDKPRWRFDEGKKIEVEHNFPRDIALSLAERGHEIGMALSAGNFGRGQIILKNQEGVLMGGCEYRADSSIAAF